MFDVNGVQIHEPGVQLPRFCAQLLCGPCLAEVTIIAAVIPNPIQDDREKIYSGDFYGHA